MKPALLKETYTVDLLCDDPSIDIVSDGASITIDRALAERVLGLARLLKASNAENIVIKCPPDIVAFTSAPDGARDLTNATIQSAMITIFPTHLVFRGYAYKVADSALESEEIALNAIADDFEITAADELVPHRPRVMICLREGAVNNIVTDTPMIVRIADSEGKMADASEMTQLHGYDYFVTDFLVTPSVQNTEYAFAQTCRGPQ